MRLLLVCLLTLPALVGQESSVISVVRGTIEGPGAISGNLVVELHDPGMHSIVERVHVTGDGHFEFHRIKEGQYTLRLTTPHGDEIRQEFVSLRSTSGDLTVRLPKERKARPIAGFVSVKQLSHPPSRKAVDAMKEAQHYSEAGDSARAIERLERAVKISPSYAEAHNNLGAHHMRAGRFTEAEQHFRVALEIAGPNSMMLCNLAAVLASLGRLEEAENHARHSLRLDPQNVSASYMIGRAVMQRAGDRQEALRHLAAAIEKHPRALLLTAQVHAAGGDTAQARFDLMQFLNISGQIEEEKQIARRWLVALERGERLR